MEADTPRRFATVPILSALPDSRTRVDLAARLPLLVLPELFDKEMILLHKVSRSESSSRLQRAILNPTPQLAIIP
jgi:hypothetical protein